MVIIPQHGANRALFDFNTFAAEIKDLQRVEEWRFRIEECLGVGADEIEYLGFPQARTMAASQFKAKYQSIYQTIDGEFVGLVQGQEVCRLLAIDSSYWEVSGSEELEREMLRRYGPYQRNA